MLSKCEASSSLCSCGTKGGEAEEKAFAPNALQEITVANRVERPVVVLEERMLFDFVATIAAQARLRVREELFDEVDRLWKIAILIL